MVRVSTRRTTTRSRGRPNARRIGGPGRGSSRRSRPVWAYGCSSASSPDGRACSSTTAGTGCVSFLPSAIVWLIRRGAFAQLDYGAKPNVPASEGTPTSCANWTSTDDPFSAPLPRGYKASSSRFHIPFSSLDRFFVHGQGSFAKGKLKIEVVEDPTWDEDSTAEEKREAEAVVDVEARFNDDRLLELMQVCAVVGQKEAYTNGSSTGLGIYVSIRFGRSYLPRR